MRKTSHGLSSGDKLPKYRQKTCLDNDKDDAQEQYVLTLYVLNFSEGT